MQLVWLVPLLPLLGFVLNGTIALTRIGPVPPGCVP